MDRLNRTQTQFSACIALALMALASLSNGHGEINASTALDPIYLPGTGGYRFTVQYGAFPSEVIDQGSFGDDDVFVRSWAHGMLRDTPIWKTEFARFIEATPVVGSSGVLWEVTYEVAAPSQLGWQAEHNGRFEVFTEVGNVTAGADVGITAQMIGEFEVSIAQLSDRNRNQILFRSEMMPLRTSVHAFDVVYSSEAPIDVASIGDNDLLLRDDRALVALPPVEDWQHQFARLVNVKTTDDARHVHATYEIDKPTTSPPDYLSVTLQADAVATSEGTLPSRFLGTLSFHGKVFRANTRIEVADTAGGQLAVEASVYSFGNLRFRIVDWGEPVIEGDTIVLNARTAPPVPLDQWETGPTQRHVYRLPEIITEQRNFNDVPMPEFALPSIPKGTFVFNTMEEWTAWSKPLSQLWSGASLAADVDFHSETLAGVSLGDESGDESDEHDIEIIRTSTIGDTTTVDYTVRIPESPIDRPGLRRHFVRVPKVGNVLFRRTDIAGPATPVASRSHYLPIGLNEPAGSSHVIQNQEQLDALTSEGIEVEVPVDFQESTLVAQIIGEAQGCSSAGFTRFTLSPRGDFITAVYDWSPPSPAIDCGVQFSFLVATASIPKTELPIRFVREDSNQAGTAVALQSVDLPELGNLITTREHHVIQSSDDWVGLWGEKGLAGNVIAPPVDLETHTLLLAFPGKTATCRPAAFMSAHVVDSVLVASYMTNSIFGQGECLTPFPVAAAAVPKTGLQVDFREWLTVGSFNFFGSKPLEPIDASTRTRYKIDFRLNGETYDLQLLTRSDPPASFGDLDNDGFLDRTEWAMGSDPARADRIPELTAIKSSEGSGVELGYYLRDAASEAVVLERSSDLTTWSSFDSQNPERIRQTSQGWQFREHSKGDSGYFRVRVP